MSGSGCEQTEGNDADAVGASIGVGSGVDDDGVQQIGAEVLGQPVQVSGVPVAPIGYAIFATALGIWVGSRIARTIPAMITTLALFVAVRLAVTLQVRPRLAAPKTVRREILAQDPHQQVADWVLHSRTLDRNGVLAQGDGLDLSRLTDRCPELPRAGLPDPELVNHCMIELGLYTTAAVLLLVLAYRRTTTALR